MTKIEIPKLAKGGIIDTPIKSITPVEYMHSMFMTYKEMTEKIEHQKAIIDRLSRKIQKKNQKYRKLKAEKMPPTLYGHKVIIVPDSIASSMMMVNEDVLKGGL